MQGLTSYLSKYTALGASERKQREVVARAISVVCGAPVHPSQVVIDFGTAHTHIPSSVRWVLYEKKEEILMRIAHEIGAGRITDIR